MKGQFKYIINLVLATLLLLGASNLYAQVPPINTGDDPFLGTTHRYQVTADNLINNTTTWFITNETDPNTHLPSEVLVTSSGAGNVLYADITFSTPTFSAGTYILTYVETSKSTGACVATREFVIHLRENNFYETAYNEATENPATSFSECHDSTGTVQDWSIVNVTNYHTTIHYLVYMNKDTDFDLNTWEFDATITEASAGYSIISVDKGAATSNRGANFSVNPISGSTYKVVVNAPLDGDTKDFVDIKVVVSGPMYEDVEVQLAVTNGLARSGTAFTVVTTDNIAIYPTDGTYTKDRWRTKTVSTLGIPATHNIVHGEGETATTAQNPLQNSTHRYVVTMADKTNNTGSWYINEADGDPVANYELVHRGSSAINDTVSIAFHMAPGYYVLYFNEENDNGCSTVRAYPFTLVGPFVVNLTENFGNNCATISGDVNNTPGTATTTEVVYTVSLPSAYYADWYFDFSVSSAPGFNADMDVANVVVAPAVGVTVTGSGASRSVRVAGSVTSVTFTVTYSGFYQNEHEITSLLDNITGSFNETVDNVSIKRTIYSIPQAGILAGVD